MKDKLVDMSIDPSTVKGKETEVAANPKSRKVKPARKSPKHYPSHHKGHGGLSNTICIKNGEVVKQVPRSEVERLVGAGWTYCPRKEWKAKVRDNSLAPKDLSIPEGGFKVGEVAAVVSKKKKKLKGA